MTRLAVWVQGARPRTLGASITPVVVGTAAAGVFVPWRFVAALLGLLIARYAFAFEPFVVRDIRLEGLQRVEAGTVFSYLPVKVGDRVDDEKLSAAVKALYATGFFRDVRLERIWEGTSEIQRHIIARDLLRPLGA